MQFHLNGFHAGDPEAARVDPPVPGATPAPLPGTTDVLIVGCGPAGLTLAAQLAAFPGISTRIVEQKAGPLMLGQADGIACRTMEMFNAFGFAERVLREAYWVNELVFWKPDSTRRDAIYRSDRIRDTEEGLSEFPHVILNQARVHDFYLETMRRGASPIVPDYHRRLASLEVSTEPDVSHPVTARFERLDPGHEGEVEAIRARYAVGCDGARSAVRREIGLSLEGASANQAWGVMDVLAVTDFPDIRLKCVIHSAAGNMVIIPREGGYLVRLYIEMDKLAENERVASRQITVDHLIAAARRILSPYTLEVKEVAWWSVYEIGQRLCGRFDDVPTAAKATRPPRVFIAGDACHTHSPKAGQGMNVSMQDAFNLGWKLAAVLRGQVDPALLATYSVERHAVAEELIAFDRKLARMLSLPPKDPHDPDSEGVDPAEFQAYFVQQGRFTAGTAMRYAPSAITGAATHQHLAEGLAIGMRFHSAPVIRLADAKPMHLGHTVQADGRWRLFAFAAAEDPAAPSSRIQALCRFLEGDAASPIRRHTPEGEDIDAVIDLRAIFQQPHRELAFGAMPALLRPAKGRHGLVDHEKMFCPVVANGQDIFDLRGIDRGHGCVVIVRPDQHVAHVLSLEDHAGIADFFSAFMLNGQQAVPRRDGASKAPLGFSQQPAL
ncbi:Phenol 2-monooxygenase (plasmid) [Roseomonas mucosa]|uniref:Phenol 2-monooxygenase n=2 Tax=Roseomonas mucosa TaxID=207340 RepID=A0A4Y1MSH6_9PROT|nr:MULTISPECIES: FAD-binding monooxygenase [Roseomonas]AWV20563.1 Phenol 2-monooxygenase [Roseomonas mucosa]MDT8356061.1 FAD-binding monooxygenase [Roseomonas mucosa]MDU7521141.1 FAD-binding monooxygenase [Roseomonas mucosa]QDJ11654.1 Phenol 2-monooxygenase [Roseomonas mucosa]USQ73803.1 FAD-binding monooxygenase [Roseomonas mucosa]